MNKLFLVPLMLLPSLAFAFPIDVTKKLNGAEIVYNTTTISSNMAAINIQNVGGTAAQCRVVFVNGPENPRVRNTVVQSGSSSYVTANFNRAVIRLRITLTCNPT
ncbi:hypothetical protein [Metapseudomonas resinovorans]|uniref:3-phosphoglycerate kinase n=1 Tax=Metapseudomonas resinovorans NBRC 106553 TaxID=1245471 RepID=S6BEJ2_METRE|nr:hypothetical protein [Pseudomonas resinovorans]BAN47459.1 hypothetical protein PCA10_17270 [Pseudomonas resinovorans NBRC 106553]